MVMRFRSISSSAGVRRTVGEHNVAYVSFFEAELKAERDRKSALDTRGNGLVAASASLTALLAGIGALLKTGTSPSIPGFVAPLVIMSLIFFVLAALSGIGVQWNWRYPVTDTAGLRQMFDEHWQDPETNSRRTVARITNRNARRSARGEQSKREVSACRVHLPSRSPRIFNAGCVHSDCDSRRSLTCAQFDASKVA
jgi:hypothetical protein